MPPMKLLNNLLFMENLIGIYRNYCSQQKNKKYLINFQILVLTMFNIIVVIYELYLLLGRDAYSQIRLIYACIGILHCLLSVFSVVTIICYSRDFMLYYKSIICVFECFKYNKQLTNSLKNVICIGITFNSIFFAISVFKNAESLINLTPSHPKVNLVPILVSQVVIRYIIVIQHLMLYFVVMIVVHLFKCLNSLIIVVHERVKRCDIISDEQCYITREQIQGWVELYQDLANSCDKVSLCFGRQYFFSLVLSVSQYILVTYRMCYINVVTFAGSYDWGQICIIIFSYITVMMMPLIAGQMASNQGVKFRRALVRLHNTMIIGSGKAEAKLIKDFIRLIKNKPIVIKLLSNLPAGMYMLPVVSMLAVNYLIVILQFNHVI